MRRLSFWIVVAALPLVLNGGASAGKKRVSRAAAASPDEPAPGECVETQTGIKTCATRDGTGVFDVRSFPPDAVLVRFQEPITRVVPPPDRLFQVQWTKGENMLVVAPRQSAFPNPTTVVVTAGAATVTLQLRPTTGQRDTQMTIVDPGRDAVEAEIERRTAERLAPLKAEIDAERRKLDERASERAHELILDDLAREGASVRAAAGNTIGRNDHNLVIRAKEIVRVGRRYFAVITLENLSADPFDVMAVRAWASDGSGDKELTPTWRFASTVIDSGEEVRGVVALPQKVKVSAKTRLRVRIESKDAARTVELAGIEVRP